MSLFSKKSRGREVKHELGGRPPLSKYYRAERTGAASPFVRKPVSKNRRRLLLGFLDILLILFLLFGLGYSLALNARPKVIVSDSSFHPPSVYTAVVAAQLRQFKNRTKMTFDEQGVTLQLQKQFPEISNVQIELPFFSEQATVRLTIAQPSFKLVSRGTSYIVGTNGEIVATSADLPNVKNLATVYDQSGFNASVGKPVLSSGSTGFIRTVVAECQRFKVPIASLVLPTTPQELDLRTTDQPYYVKFNLDGDALNEVGQFLAARHRFAQTNQTPSQYLDVRVEGKIFYK